MRLHEAVASGLLRSSPFYPTFIIKTYIWTLLRTAKFIILRSNITSLSIMLIFLLSVAGIPPNICKGGMSLFTTLLGRIADLGPMVTLGYILNTDYRKRYEIRI